MRLKSPTNVADAEELEGAGGEELLRPLLVDQPVATNADPQLVGVVIGELLGITDNGRTPLVRFSAQPGTAAVAAQTTIDLHGEHIGLRVVLMFEGGNPARPVVLGLLREDRAQTLASSPGTVDVDADGERLVVTAREQLVLRCGKASITLTRTGKVLIQGAHISSRASGVNRLKGGSVQLN